MKTIVTFLLILTTTFSFAQFPKPNPTSERVKAMAEGLTKSYNQELGLNGVQYPLFKGIVEKYIIQAEEVKEKLEGREELDMLVELQTRETLEMNDLLTQPQYRLYKKLKFDLQPLKTVEK